MSEYSSEHSIMVKTVRFHNFIINQLQVIMLYPQILLTRRDNVKKILV